MLIFRRLSSIGTKRKMEKKTKSKVSDAMAILLFLFSSRDCLLTKIQEITPIISEKEGIQKLKYLIGDIGW